MRNKISMRGFTLLESPTLWGDEYKSDSFLERATRSKAPPFLTGFSLLEILIAITIIAILAAFMGIQVRNLTQRARVAAAKATISGFGLALSAIKTHTGFHPPFLADTMEVHPPTAFTGAGIGGWWGPYAEGLSLIDPWGNPYLYFFHEANIPPTQIFYQKFDKNTEIYLNFSTTFSKGVIIIENHGVTDGDIDLELNDEEEIDIDEETSVAKLPVALLPDNILEVEVEIETGGFWVVKIMATSDWLFSGPFTLLSLGADGKPGGTGFNADIIYGKF